MAKLALCFGSWIGGLMCVLVAGCSSEPATSPPTKPSRPTVETRILPPAEARQELDRLLKRTEGLSNNPSYTLGAQSNQQGEIMSINLEAEFAYGCGCCFENLCSEVTDDDIAFFGSFEALEVLHMPSSALRGHGLKAVRDLKHLRELDLSWSPVRDDALVHLANVTGLESLNLSATLVTGEGLNHLAGLPDLTRLSILGCDLSSEGWTALGSLTQLKHLELMATKADGVDQHLRHLASLRQLETVRVDSISSRPNLDAPLKPLSVRHEPAEPDQLLRWIGGLPNLTRVVSSVPRCATQDGLRHFPDAPRLEHAGVSIEIVPETASSPGDRPSRDLLARFDALKELRIRVDCSSIAESEGIVEICEMDALESLSVSMPGQGAECYLHDLPNLRDLKIETIRQSLYHSCESRQAVASCFECVRLEDLPRLQTVTMHLPRELVVRNVATQPEPETRATQRSGRRVRLGLRCVAYGVLNESVARNLASVDNLVRLDLNPQIGSAPKALSAFRDHPILAALGVRLNEAPREWIAGIAALDETLEVLELPPPRLQSHGDQSGVPLDGPAIAPLAQMKDLTTLTLRNVIDPEGEPVSWICDLPHLEQFNLIGHDMGRLSIRLSNDKAHWNIREGRIGTVELSRWPESSANASLRGGRLPSIYIGSEVDHYEIRDMPHATHLKLSTEETNTVLLDGDLSSLEKVELIYSNADWIVSPTAYIPRLKWIPRKSR